MAEARRTSRSRAKASATSEPVVDAQLEGEVAGEPAGEAEPPPGAEADVQPGDGEPGDAQDDEAAEPLTESATGQAAKQAGPVAAPLEPPTLEQDAPHAGYLETSTNPVAPLAGLHSNVGETHERLVGVDGNTLDPETLFDDPGPRSTVVFYNQRVVEEYRPDGAKTVTRRLLGRAGQPIPREHADEIRRVYAVPEQVPMSETRPR